MTSVLQDNPTPAWLRHAERRPRSHNPSKVERAVRRLCAGEPAPPECARQPAVRAAARVADLVRDDAPTVHVAACRLLLLCWRRARGLLSAAAKEDALGHGLAGLARATESWLKAPDGWRPRGKSPRRQLSSLARHLVLRYPVPPWVEAGWLAGDGLAQALTVHLGQGRSLRRAKGLPIPLTRRAAHFALEAPRSSTPLQALRWGQARALGLSAPQADAVLGTRLGQVAGDHRFWASVLRFFAAHPLLDVRLYGPVIDYLHAQRFGRVPGVAPPHPRLSMRGRTPGALLREVTRWHEQLAKLPYGDLVWSPCEGLVPLEWEVAEGDAWEVRELCSAEALHDEGRRMRHCVATYALACARGRSSIWSVRRRHKGVELHQATLEVARGRRALVQARARANATPCPAAQAAIRRWAVINSVEVNDWALL